MKKHSRILLALFLVVGTLLTLASCTSGGGTNVEDFQAKATEQEKYNNLSDEGVFVLYKESLSGEELENIRNVAFKDLTETQKASFDEFRKNNYFFLDIATEEIKNDKDEVTSKRQYYVLKERFEDPVQKESDGKKMFDENGNPIMDTSARGGDPIMVGVTDKDGNPVLDENGKQVMMNKFYIEMKDRGFKFIEVKENGVKTGKYTLEAAEATEESKGIFYWILKPVGIAMNFLNNVTHSYILALFIFAVLVKIILFPFGIKQQKSMVKQAYFKPKERAIRNKYKGRDDKVTQQKCQQEIMDAQQAEGVSAFGGCLPILIQMPIILLLYEVIRSPLSYVAGYSSSLVSTLRNILCYNSTTGLALTDTIKGYIQASAVSRITELDMVPMLRDNWTCFADVAGMSEKAVSDLPNFYAFGNHVDLSFTPTFSTSGWYYLYLLIPVITFVALYISTKLNKKMTGVLNEKVEGAPDMGIAGKIMDFAMPALSAYFTFKFPAVLGVYWIFNNLLGTVQQYILKKMYPFPVFTEEDYKKAEREYNKGKETTKKKVSADVEDTPSEPKPKKKSAYDDDDGDYPVLPPMDDDDDSVYIKKNEKKGKVNKAPVKKDENSDDKSDKN